MSLWDYEDAQRTSITVRQMSSDYKVPDYHISEIEGKARMGCFDEPENGIIHPMSFRAKSPKNAWN